MTSSRRTMYYKGDPLKVFFTLLSKIHRWYLHVRKHYNINDQCEFWPRTFCHQTKWNIKILIRCSQCRKRAHNYIFDVQQRNISGTKYATGMKLLLLLIWCSTTWFSCEFRGCIKSCLIDFSSYFNINNFSRTNTELHLTLVIEFTINTLSTYHTFL